VASKASLFLIGVGGRNLEAERLRSDSEVSVGPSSYILACTTFC